jgi:hypothetical protein
MEYSQFAQEAETKRDEEAEHDEVFWRETVPH